MDSDGHFAGRDVAVCSKSCSGREETITISISIANTTISITNTTQKVVLVLVII